MYANGAVYKDSQQSSINAEKSIEKFAVLDEMEQVKTLVNILRLFGAGAGGTDLENVGGKKASGARTLSSNLSNWKKQYTDVRIIDQSASGLFERHSENLLEL